MKKTEYNQLLKKYEKENKGSKVTETRRQQICNKVYSETELAKLSEKELADLLISLSSSNRWKNSPDKIRDFIKENTLKELRKQIRNLLYGKKALDVRWDDFLKNVKHFGVSTMSELLCIVYPKECIMCDSATKKIFDQIMVAYPKNPKFNGADYLKLIEGGKELITIAKDKKITTVYDFLSFNDFCNKVQEKKKGANKEDESTIKEAKDEVVVENVETSEEKLSITAGEKVERIEEMAKEINDSVQSELLKKLHNIPPKSFEKLVVKVLEELDYGKGGVTIRITQETNDHGIDGYVSYDELGMKKLCCFQAKRYIDKIEVNLIRDFVGALAEADCDTGVFVTTSTFTKPALIYNANGFKLLRIDGKNLVEYMIRYQIGIQSKTIYVNGIDESFFEDLQ